MEPQIKTFKHSGLNRSNQPIKTILQYYGEIKKIYVTTFICRYYNDIPRDLLLLGFIPESKAGLIKDLGIVEVNSGFYGAQT